MGLEKILKAAAKQEVEDRLRLVKMQDAVCGSSQMRKLRLASH